MPEYATLFHVMILKLLHELFLAKKDTLVRIHRWRMLSMASFVQHNQAYTPVGIEGLKADSIIINLLF